MAKTKAQIIAEAQVVKNATEVGENTATRVGTVLEDLAEKINEYVSGRFYGYAATSADLPEGDEVGYAYVGSSPFEIWNFDGTTWSDSGATIANAPVPNMEDIDYNTANELQFANRVYNSTTPDGLGYKILRKSSTFAAQVTEANTIYEIRYKFDLNGGSVTIPSGCVLEFDGGSVTNGTLTFNGTTLKGLREGSITECRFNGTITNEEINVQHLGVSSALADAATAINDIVGLLTSEKRKKMYFPADTYTTYSPIVPCNNLEIYGDGEASKIQNLATTGSAKHVIRTEWFPALSTGAARSNSYTKYPVTSISDDRMSIEVSGNFSLAVGDLSVVFGGLAPNTGTTPYYYYTYVGIVTEINGTTITFDQPLPVNDNYTDYIFAPSAKGTQTAAFWSKNVYVHDLFLYQLTGTTSGYYCLTGGYNCRYERLKMHTSTPMGSNFAAHCVFKDIVADCEAGFWDSAELQYDNLYENIVVTRFASRLNVIGFNITNGSYNKVRNLTLVGNKADVGGDYTCHLQVDGIVIKNCTYNLTTSNKGILACAEDGIFRNVTFDGCSVATGTGSNLFIVNSARGIAENIAGQFDVAEGITASNRFVCHRITNIDISPNYHTGSVMNTYVNKYRLYSRLQSTQIAFGNNLINANLAEFIKGGVFVHTRFDIIYPDSSKSTTGSNVRLYMSNAQVYINFSYRFTNYNWVEAEMFITAGDEKADYVLILRNPECHEIVSGTLNYPTRTGSVLSLKMRTGSNTDGTYYNNYCYTEIYY